MPRVVPSQVVELIDVLFEQAVENERLGRAWTLNRAHGAHVEAIVTLTSEIPPELILLEAVDYSAYVATLATLRHALSDWVARENSIHRVPGLRRQPIALLRELLAKCPDEAIPAGTTALEFIGDEPLRDSIRLDLAAANSALVNGEWKAATVLAGGAAEALLLWRISLATDVDRTAAVAAATDRGALEQRPAGDPNRWALHELTEVARCLGVIEQATRDQLHLTRGFRNLIHPGRAVRLGQTCNRGTALAAIAGVELAIRDLAG